MPLKTKLEREVRKYSAFKSCIFARQNSHRFYFHVKETFKQSIDVLYIIVKYLIIIYCYILLYMILIRIDLQWHLENIL